MVSNGMSRSKTGALQCVCTWMGSDLLVDILSFLFSPICLLTRLSAPTTPIFPPTTPAILSCFLLAHYARRWEKENAGSAKVSSWRQKSHSYISLWLFGSLLVSSHIVKSVRSMVHRYPVLLTSSHTSSLKMCVLLNGFQLFEVFKLPNLKNQNKQVDKKQRVSSDRF